MFGITGRRTPRLQPKPPVRCLFEERGTPRGLPDRSDHASVRDACRLFRLLCGAHKKDRTPQLTAMVRAYMFCLPNKNGWLIKPPWTTASSPYSREPATGPADELPSRPIIPTAQPRGQCDIPQPQLHPVGRLAAWITATARRARLRPTKAGAGPSDRTRYPRDAGDRLNANGPAPSSDHRTCLGWGRCVQPAPNPTIKRFPVGDKAKAISTVARSVHRFHQRCNTFPDVYHILGISTASRRTAAMCCSTAPRRLLVAACQRAHCHPARGSR
jgi:hypothetical protein